MSYHVSIGEALFGEECEQALRRAQDKMWELHLQDRAERAMARTGVPVSLLIKVAGDDALDMALGQGRR